MASRKKRNYYWIALVVVLAVGAVAFFSKPLDHAGLLSLIERTVNQTAKAGQIAPEMDFAI